MEYLPKGKFIEYFPKGNFMEYCISQNLRGLLYGIFTQTYEVGFMEYFTKLKRVIF